MVCVYLKSTGERLELKSVRGYRALAEMRPKGTYEVIVRPDDAKDFPFDAYPGSQVEVTLTCTKNGTYTYFPMEAATFPPIIVNGVEWSVSMYGHYETSCFKQPIRLWKQKENYQFTFLRETHVLQQKTLHKALAAAVVIAEREVRLLYEHLEKEVARQQRFKPTPKNLPTRYEKVL